MESRLLGPLLAALLSPASGAEYGPMLEGSVVGIESMAVEDTGSFGCSDQALRGGVQLPDLPFFYTRITPDAAFGTPELVDLVVEVGRHMSWAMPNASPFTVGDISHRSGGAIYGHQSHRGGVDADIGIYRKGPKGPVQAANQFMDFPTAELDVEATWLLIDTLLDSGMVEYILLDRSHIATLRTYVLRAGLLSVAEAAGIFAPENAWERIGVIRHAPSHRDHLHVRVLCGDGTRAGW